MSLKETDAISYVVEQMYLDVNKNESKIMFCFQCSVLEVLEQWYVL